METTELFAGGALKVKEAAALGGVCANTIRRLMRSGDLPFVRFGRVRGVRLAYDDVLRFVARRRDANSEAQGVK